VEATRGAANLSKASLLGQGQGKADGSAIGNGKPGRWMEELHCELGEARERKEEGVGRKDGVVLCLPAAHGWWAELELISCREAAPLGARCMRVCGSGLGGARGANRMRARSGRSD
jgi:hypothetical protein